MANIARQRKVSIHKVVYWMEKYKIPRRSRSEATYVQKNPLGDPFRITFINSVAKTELFALGIGLFLGEGNKKDKFHRIYQDCLDYWVKVTGIPKLGFYKPTIRPRKIGTYKNKSKYGTITINVSNKKLLNQIKFWCDNYLNRFAEVAQW